MNVKESHKKAFIRSAEECGGVYLLENKKGQNFMYADLPVFTKFCLMNNSANKVSGRTHGGSQFMNYWHESKNLAEFKKKVLADDSLTYTQGYAELSKLCDGHDDRCEKMMQQADIICRAWTDGGEVSISCGNGEINLSNGLGDGTFWVSIFETPKAIQEFNSSMLEYPGVNIRGKGFRLLNSDKSYVFNGSFYYYVYEGFTAFVKDLSY